LQKKAAAAAAPAAAAPAANGKAAAPAAANGKAAAPAAANGKAAAAAPAGPPKDPNDPKVKAEEVHWCTCGRQMHGNRLTVSPLYRFTVLPSSMSKTRNFSPRMFPPKMCLFPQISHLRVPSNCYSDSNSNIDNDNDTHTLINRFIALIYRLRRLNRLRSSASALRCASAWRKPPRPRRPRRVS